MSVLRPTTDGVVVIRPPEPGDPATLVAGRDEAFHRFLGQGDEQPRPTGCIVVDDEVAGWVDYDADRAWLRSGEVNVGYNVFAPHRGQGYGSRAVQLLMHHLAVDTEYEVATLLIHPENERSLALATRTRFSVCGDLDGSRSFKRPVPPLVYTDGVASIRRLRDEDLATDLERAHTLQGLRASREAFGTGPKWTFAVDGAHAADVAYVDCDLANEHVPPGEANISYSSHPEHRGRGYASRTVRLVMQFLGDHTAALRFHLIVDADDRASRRVAAAVGARPTERWVTGGGHTMIRHERTLD